MRSLVPKQSKLESFDGKHFRCWYQNFMFVLEAINISNVLMELKLFKHDKQHEPARTRISEA